MSYHTILVAVALVVSSSLLADDWVVPQSWQVHAENLTFESEGLQLSGTLYWPDSSDKIAAIVIPQQNGTELRSHPLYQQKVRVFNSLGYAAFVYDRRGFGASEGGNARLSYDSLAADAVAAKQRIALHNAIDPSKIGFWGLSQSGWISMLAANKSNAAFVMVISSPLTTPEEQMDVLTYNYVRLTHGKEAAERALEVRQLVMTDYFEGEVDYSEVQKQIRSIQDKPWFQYVYIPSANDFPKDISNSTWQAERVFDPMLIAKQLSIPALFMFGSRDIDIPVKRSIELLRSPGLSDAITVKVIPDADHVMRHFKEPNQRSEDDEFRGAEVPEYFANLGAWLTKAVSTTTDTETAKVGPQSEEYALVER